MGYKSDHDKVPYFLISDINIHPGMVGLHILDAFKYETPIVTTDNGIHSPEIDYMNNGENGIMTPNEIEVYVDEVVGILKNEKILSRLKAGCRRSSDSHTIRKNEQ